MSHTPNRRQPGNCNPTTTGFMSSYPSPHCWCDECDDDRSRNFAPRYHDLIGRDNRDNSYYASSGNNKRWGDYGYHDDHHSNSGTGSSYSEGRLGGNKRARADEGEVFDDTEAKKQRDEVERQEQIAKIARLETELAEFKEEKERLEKELKEKNGTIDQRDATIDQRDTTIERRNATIKRRDATIKQLREDLASANELADKWKNHREQCNKRNKRHRDNNKTASMEAKAKAPKTDGITTNRTIIEMSRILGKSIVEGFEALAQEIDRDEAPKETTEVQVKVSFGDEESDEE